MAGVDGVVRVEELLRGDGLLRRDGMWKDGVKTAILIWGTAEAAAFEAKVEVGFQDQECAQGLV